MVAAGARCTQRCGVFEFNQDGGCAGAPPVVVAAVEQRLKGAVVAVVGIVDEEHPVGEQRQRERGDQTCQRRCARSFCCRCWNWTWAQQNASLLAHCSDEPMQIDGVGKRMWTCSHAQRVHRDPRQVVNELRYATRRNKGVARRAT